MGSATFFDAFNALSIAFVLPILVPLWPHYGAGSRHHDRASYVGQVVGALAFSWAAERYGRVPCAAAATAIYALMSLACAGAWSFGVLLICRFIQGIGVGARCPSRHLYQRAFPCPRRGRSSCCYEMIFPIGLMVTGQVGALLVPLFGWQIMFMIGGIPGLLIALALFVAAGIPTLADRQGTLGRSRGRGAAAGSCFQQGGRGDAGRVTGRDDHAGRRLLSRRGRAASGANCCRLPIAAAR